MTPTSLSTGQAAPYGRDNVSLLFEGQNAVFVCDPSGQVSDNLTYQWTLNNTHIIATGRSFTIHNVRSSDSGLYKCIVRGKIMDKEVVAEHATFAYIKKTETMHTQVVDEGVSVTVLCNVTRSNVPQGSKNMRFQWHNPNGTLVSNEWFLRLADIRIHESGVYVCTVSVDVDGVRHEASRGTNIQVKRAGSVIFPGLLGHTIEVMETSPVHQTCRVEKDYGGANYTYHWLGPNQREIANDSQLRIDYALRSATRAPTLVSPSPCRLHIAIWRALSTLSFPSAQMAQSVQLHHRNDDCTTSRSFLIAVKGA
ncbi:hypothetical protein TcWFU_008840 [Taenia crassiceps]|uniref:Soluble interferon alpha/beta receptor OPG204 n=1 Tax=Taenia crassiceps TaxID=6207 RepID=A0ABR4QFA4_9CEST